MSEAITMPVKVHLIRHGETEWSLSGQHTGSTDIALTEQGERQARGLGERLRSATFTIIFTSPRRRAQQTYALSGLTPASEIEPDLAEWDYGDYEGRRTVDIRKERPDWNLFLDGCPNGEMPIQVCARADRFIARLRALHGNVALFSHGHFGSVLAARWIGLPVINARNLPLGTASISMLGFAANHPGVPIIALLNSSGSF
jgi:broad specificity phosphatase PhoE